MWSFVSTWPFSRQTAEIGAEVLKNGGKAMDAVIEGIHRVESDPNVDCVGKGGFLNEKGELALDAAVMDGDTLKTGAVCAVRGFENPVDIARALMDNTRHSILVGTGAEEFARKMGIPESAMEDLITETARENWRQAAGIGHDTIGAIALDENGSMAVATSTSGANMKLCGRVGDSPIIGSGFYVESGVGGACATGWGEDIMRTCCSYRCVSLMADGMSPAEAVAKVVRTAHETIVRHGGRPDCIALVCMNAKGECAAACNHREFSYVYVWEGMNAPLVIEKEPVIDKDAGDKFIDGVVGYER
ncbi:MAG: N(4)-(beta-N-acetylglucosaminyl)-L-asparaginase [Clostridia bacterium]|nr:N(4)-(beta-N-acetylglucosaminyl)-L-asparaginase [Clostridia bacterium]